MSSVPSLRVYVCGRLALEQGEIAIREADFRARQGRRLAETEKLVREPSGG
jgi:hypothetical protein